jgi:23S rRNA pseudouridine2605 synthase
MPEERLQKILSHAGIASRRTAEEMILAGRVKVDGQVRQTLGARADIETQTVTVDGVPVNRSGYRYFLLHKPAGFVTTANDELGRETVLDLVPIGDVQLHPVGRLDKDSEGLLLITNDGHLTGLLTHPRHEVEKEYLVGLARPLGKDDAARLVRGVTSEGERLRARSVARAAAPAAALDEPGETAPEYWALVTLAEGKKREVRRMFKALGNDVRVLRRIRLGPLHLGSLGSGAFRELTEEEVGALYAAAVQAARASNVGPDRIPSGDDGRQRARQPPGPNRH